MIIIPHGSIEHKNNETRTPAVQRVRESTRYMQEGRGVSCHTIIEGRKYKLASIYAPSASNARPAFFEKLRRFITKKTILGIDANCVPDTTLDVKQAAGVTSAYDNVGADELNDVIIEKELEQAEIALWGGWASKLTATPGEGVTAPPRARDKC